MPTLIARAPLRAFFILAFILSWAVMIPMVLLQGSPQWTVLATLGPTIAALLVSRVTTGRFRFSTPPRNGVAWSRLVCGALAGVALVMTAFVVLPGISTADPGKLNWSILLSLQVFNYSTLAGGPVGEEIGWTGFAHRPMQERFGPLPGTLLLGVLWALWHLPLFLRPGFFSTPFWIYVLILVGLRLIIATCSNWAGFSIVVAIVTHAAFNTTSSWLGGLFIGIQPQSSLPFELIMAFGGGAIAALLLFATRLKLAFH